MSSPTPAHALEPALGEPTLADDDWDELGITPPKRTSWITKVLALGAVAALSFAGGAFAHRTWGASSGQDAGSAASIVEQLAAGGAGLPGFGNGAAFGGTGAAATSGEVKYIRGNSLYVEKSDGTTIKVKVAKSVQVSKTQTTDIRGIDAGDQVVVQGTTGKDGTVTASRVTVGGAIGAIRQAGTGAQTQTGGGAGFQPGG